MTRTWISVLSEKILAGVWIFLLLILVTGGNGHHPLLFKVYLWGGLALALTAVELKLHGRAWPKFIGNRLSNLAKLPLWLPSLVYVIFFTLGQIRRYRSFQTNAFDLSFITQGLWNTVHGGGFLRLSALHDTNFLAYHFAPVLALLSPLFLLPYPEYLLFFAQALLVSSGSWFLWEIGKCRAFSRSTTLLVIMLYLLYQPLWLSNFFDFREDLFFIPCLFGMFLASERRSCSALWAFALLSFFVKENAAIAVFGIGFLLFTGGRKVQGTLLALTSMILFVLLNGWIMPQIAPDRRTTMAVSKLAGLGPDVHTILNTFVHSPVQSLRLVLGVMFDGEAFRYLIKIFLPFTPLFIFARKKDFLILVPASSLVLMNLLINSQHMLGFHYEIILVPFFFMFLMGVLPRLNDRMGKSEAAAVLLLFSFASYSVSPVHLFRGYAVNREHVALAQALARIPESASVSAQTSLHPHICYREHARIFSGGKNLKEDYVVLSSLGGLSQYSHPRLIEDMSEVQSYGYSLWIDQPEVKVWCRTAICPSASF